MRASVKAALYIQAYVEDCDLTTLAELYKRCYGEDEVYQQLKKEIDGVEDAQEISG